MPPPEHSSNEPANTHNDPFDTCVFLAVVIICLIYLAFLISGLFEFGFLGLVIMIASFALSRLAKIPSAVGGFIASALGYGLLFATFAMFNFY